jgi:hypothetical protein
MVLKFVGTQGLPREPQESQDASGEPPEELSRGHPKKDPIFDSISIWKRLPKSHQN